MMGLFKDLWNTFTWKPLEYTNNYRKKVDAHTTVIVSPDKPAGENIYNADTLGGYVEKQSRIHVWLKHRLIVPMVYIAEKCLGKYLEREVPDKPYYKNLKIFDKMYEKTLVDWTSIYMAHMDEKNPEKRREYVKSGIYSRSQQNLRTLKNISLTGVRNDTAYLEFFNMLMFNLYKEMYEQYGTDPSHVLYTAKTIHDVNYFTVHRMGADVLLKQRLTDKDDPAYEELKRKYGIEEIKAKD